MNAIAGSETSAAQELLAPFCSGMGLDIGYGGLPIVKTAITLDLKPPYAHLTEPQHLTGDARRLYWFQNDAFDYVYSSHLLEDFPPVETLAVVREWLRVIKLEGRLVLLLPDEPVYRAHCEKTGQPYNWSHQNHDLTLAWFKDNILRYLSAKIEWEQSPINIYSFAIVLCKL